MNIIVELADAIEDWKGTKKGRSVAVLSRLSGVSESTINRVLKRSGEEISLENAIGLALTTLTNAEGIALISRHFPRVADWLDTGAGRGPQIPVDYQEALTSIDLLVINLLADKKRGTSSHEIREEFGNVGLLRLQELLTLGMVQEINGRYFGNDEVNVLLNQMTLTKMIENFVKLYNEANANIPQVAIKVGMFRGLSLPAIKKAYSVTRNWEKEIYDIVVDKQNRGEIPFFVGLVQNVVGGELK